ncbi:hypothetical protein MJO63_26095 [Mycobacterium ulcerans]|uniref:Uncharacterized protein n=1 Tax=Mycobacterium ulcerans TaxID=1809 RepID=A0ABY5TVI7_MYCUL|nr:hypothetical protein MJO63_26095 [Mycobacterium ulcerans]
MPVFWKPELSLPSLLNPEFPLPVFPRAPALLISRLVSWGIVD